MISQQIGYCRI